MNKKQRSDLLQKSQNPNALDLYRVSQPLLGDGPEFVNMAAKIAVLLFNVNNCVFVKEQLVLISLEQKGKKIKTRTVNPSTVRGVKDAFPFFGSSHSPHPKTPPDQFFSVTGPFGCHAAGRELFLLPPRRQSSLPPEGRARPRTPPCGKPAQLKACLNFCRKKICTKMNSFENVSINSMSS